MWTVLLLAACRGSGPAKPPITEEFLHNASVWAIEREESVVWLEAKLALHAMAWTVIRVDEEHRVAVGRVDGARVTVHVATPDVGRTQLFVAALRGATYDQQLAADLARRVRR